MVAYKKFLLLLNKKIKNDSFEKNKKKLYLSIILLIFILSMVYYVSIISLLSFKNHNFLCELHYGFLSANENIPTHILVNTDLIGTECLFY